MNARLCSSNSELPELETEQLRTIKAAIQMLAHDVRRPFSILRIGLSLLAKAQDPEGVKAVLSRLVPEVEREIGRAHV